MANEVLKLAYEATLAALREQDNTITNLLNRVTEESEWISSILNLCVSRSGSSEIMSRTVVLP